MSEAATDNNSATSTTPLSSPRVIKRVVVRRVVQSTNNNNTTTNTNNTTNNNESNNNNIEVSVQFPSSDENITESSSNLTSALSISPNNHATGLSSSVSPPSSLSGGINSPIMIVSREDESLSGQSPSTTPNNKSVLSTTMNGTRKENDSCVSPSLLVDGKKMSTHSDTASVQQSPNKKTDQSRRSTSNLSSPNNNRHSGGGGVFGFLQRIASPLLSSPLEPKQYSASFTEGSTNSFQLSPRRSIIEEETEEMRARSGGKAIANVQAADEQVVNGFLKDCQSLREKRKFAELEKLCRDFLQRYYSSKSNMAKAHIYLALALREGLLFKDSLSHFEEAFELDNEDHVNNNDEENTIVHTNSFTIADYAHTLFCDRQYEKARDYFEKALSVSIRQNQSNTEELKSAVILCQIMSPNVDPSQKAELIDDLLKKANNNQAFTHYVIGLYYEKLQDYNKAIEYYTLSLKREPSYDCNYERIGTCQSKIGLLERAKCNLDMACTLNKQNFRAILALSKLHIRAGMTGSCKTKLKIIIERSVQLVNSSSDKLRLYMILAESFYLLGIIKSSCEFETNFEKVKSLFREAIHYYSLYHELVQDNAEELEQYSVESYYNTIGLCYLYMKEFETAMDMFSKASQVSPNSCDGIYNKGVVMEQLGLFKEALQYYSKSLKIAPNDPDSSDAVKRVQRKYKNSLYTNYGMIGLDICK